MKYLLLLVITFVLSGCSTLGLPKSLEPDNAIKTAATTAVTYTIAGPVPALANLATSIGVDEVLPESKPKIEDIKTNKQLIAYIWTEFKDMILYGAIILFAFTTVIAPWAAQRRARRKRKYDQYKAEAKMAREKNQDV